MKQKLNTAAGKGTQADTLFLYFSIDSRPSRASLFNSALKSWYHQDLVSFEFFSSFSKYKSHCTASSPVKATPISPLHQFFRLLHS